MALIGRLGRPTGAIIPRFRTLSPPSRPPMKSTRALIAVLVALSAAGTVSAVGLRRRGMNAGLGPKTGLTEEQVDGIRSILNRTATER